MIDDILNEKLQIIANDEYLLKAIRKVFDSIIEKDKPKIGETNDDSLLGQKFRAYEQSRETIDKAFMALAAYKTIKSNNKNFNKER